MSAAVANLAEMKAKTTAVALSEMKPKDQIAHLLKTKQGEIAKMLPKHLNIERLLKVAQIAATTTPALLKCDVPSLIGAIGQCAQMGLEPNTVLGHSYLVPFNTKRKDAQGQEKWVNSVQVIIGYKGLIDLARRSGQIESINARVVHANDEFSIEYGTADRIVHKPKIDGERGNVLGFYAVAKLKDGGVQFEFMSVGEVREVMKGTQSKGNYGPWKDHFDEMGRKTVIRRMAKYLPLSVEFQTAVALDNMAEGGKDQHTDALEGDFMLVGDDAPTGVDTATGEITEAGGQAEAGGAQQEESGQGAGEQGQGDGTTPNYAEIEAAINAAKTPQEVDAAKALIAGIKVEGQQAELHAACAKQIKKLKGVKTTPISAE